MRFILNAKLKLQFGFTLQIKIFILDNSLKNMSEIEENITRMMRNQKSKKFIESRLTNKKLKTKKQTENADRIEINPMLFQVAKGSCLSDHVFTFPCVYELRNDPTLQMDDQGQKQNPQVGSFIRTIKMDFDMKSFQLIIHNYQYLGGAQSLVPPNGTKVTWDIQSISQVIRKNSTVKGGQMLLDSYINDKEIKQQFQMPKVQFFSVRMLQRVLSNQMASSIDLKKLVAYESEEQVPIIEQINEEMIEQQEF